MEIETKVLEVWRIINSNDNEKHVILTDSVHYCTDPKSDILINLMNPVQEKHFDHRTIEQQDCKIPANTASTFQK